MLVRAIEFYSGIGASQYDAAQCRASLNSFLESPRWPASRTSPKPVGKFPRESIRLGSNCMSGICS